MSKTHFQYGNEKKISVKIRAKQNKVIRQSDEIFEMRIIFCRMSK